MKSVKSLDFFKSVREVWEFEFGVFHYFDRLVISEMNEGVVFNWEMAKKAIKVAHQINGDTNPIAYISNRINNYYVVPTDWAKFYKNRQQLALYSVVGSTQGSFASLVMERMFFKKNIRQFTDLQEAIDWSVQKMELHATNEVG
ncbi:hypothetical protein [Maribacter sp. 2-571]|uniref:hypothetical protein n=1 Tax=Maribacter sp. 2-571 TaxID=3417569 RepID=UPI003D3432F2